MQDTKWLVSNKWVRARENVSFWMWHSALDGEAKQATHNRSTVDAHSAELLCSKLLTSAHFIWLFPLSKTLESYEIYCLCCEFRMLEPKDTHKHKHDVTIRSLWVVFWRHRLCEPSGAICSERLIFLFATLVRKREIYSQKCKQWCYCFNTD